MTAFLADLLEQYFNFPADQTQLVLRRVLVALAAVSFVLIATLIVAFDDVFPGFNAVANLEEGQVAPRAITAPDATFVSQILTEDARRAARDAVQPIYDPPDPNVARQQTSLVQEILVFVQNIRRDPFATLEQKIHDLNHITALTLNPNVATAILQMDDDTWTAIQDEIVNVLPRVMRESIRPNDEESFRYQLPTQVSVRFSPQERDIIVAIIEDLIRPNTFENPEVTEAARQTAENAVLPVSRRFVRGENVVDAGRQITQADLEALQALGLLRSDDLRAQEVVRALLASIVVVIILGLYMVRFEARLIQRDTRLLTLLAVLFLLILGATRFLGVNGNIFLFPTAAMALVFVAISSPNMAIMAMLGLALLTGLIAENSLEIAAIIAAGGIIGILGLRRAERLNSFFIAGAMVGMIEALMTSVFILATPIDVMNPETALRVLLSLLSGILIVPATAIAILYVITTLFNLTTALKLLDLSQPSKPLLQRLLRQAPGTYQHSLQVANLAEQAAVTIGADAPLTHVAALYHDIGKMENPLYFTENQQDIGNPHDTLNDPYRSADIIIKHATEGDEIAKQYRLPQRIRDFIREHHGTTQVYVFYQRALNAADGDTSAVDVNDFTYPGPRPQSKETAILMLADSCEAAVRSAKLQHKQDIADIVDKIMDAKSRDGQLDESGLTLNDLRAIRTTFVEMLQSVFHPRINYQEAIARKQPTPTTPPIVAISSHEAIPMPQPSSAKTEPRPVAPPATVPETLKPDVKVTNTDSQSLKKPTPAAFDEEPMTEVPRLPRTEDKRMTGLHQPVKSSNGAAPAETPLNPETNPEDKST